MDIEQLIETLARDVAPVPRHAVARRLCIGLGLGAVATLLYVAPDAPARLDALRAAWAAGAVEGAVEGGASCWDGMLVGRLVARDGAALRAAVASGLECLRDGRALPRVWMC